MQKSLNPVAASQLVSFFPLVRVLAREVREGLVIAVSVFPSSRDVMTSPPSLNPEEDPTYCAGFRGRISANQIAKHSSSPGPSPFARRL